MEGADGEGLGLDARFFSFGRKQGRKGGQMDGMQERK